MLGNKHKTAKTGGRTSLKRAGNRKMAEISFNKFRDLTRHKKVTYQFFARNGNIKSFQTDQFYCNKDFRLKMYCMRSFNLGLEGKFSQVSDNKFEYTSEYGRTVFVVGC